MNAKALSLGAVLGFLVAIAPSCGGGSKCGPQNCGGCCNATGICVPRDASNSPTACGTQGIACVDCTKQSMTCNPATFSCQGGTGGGTGGGSTGGGAGGGAGGGSVGGGGGGGSVGGGTGGGTGGGSTGGGAGGGGGSASCSLQAQDCGDAGACMVSNLGTGAMQCFPGACNVVLQDCPTGTDKCTYVPSGGGAARGCTPAGAKVEDEQCGLTGGADDCAKGLVCSPSTTLPDGGAGRMCVKFCAARAGDCATGKACTGALQFTGLSEYALICARTQAACDPLTQNCPNTADNCAITASGSQCVAAGTVATGQACTTVSSCQKGSACIQVQGAGNLCLKVCRVSGGTPSCTTGTCQSIGSGDVGVCPP